MKKLILTLTLVVLFCSTMSAQIIINQPKKGYTHSSTLIVVDKPQTEWHCTAGIQGSFYWPYAGVAFSALNYRPSGLMFGAIADVNYVEFDYAEWRLMPTIGYMFNPGQDSFYFTVSYGIANDFDEHEVWYGADFAIGYRFTIRNGNVLSVSTGYTGSFDWLGVPFRIAIEF